MNSIIEIRLLAGFANGSKYLLETMGKTILIDCGAYQEQPSWSKPDLRLLPVKMKDIDLMLLLYPHSDLDHFLAGLVESGFNGQLLSANPDLDKTRSMPEVSGHWAVPDHRPVALRETLREEDILIHQLMEVPEGVWVILDDNLRVRFQDHGHPFIEVDIFGEHLVFSSDTERQADYLLFDAGKQERADDFLPDFYANQSFEPAPSPRSVPESSFWLG